MPKPRQQNQPLEPWIAKIKEKGSTPLPHGEDMGLGSDLDAVWARIEQSLDAKARVSTGEISAKEKTPSASGKKRARTIPFHRYMSVAATTLLLVVLGITVFTRPNRTRNQSPQERSITASNASQDNVNPEKGGATTVEKVGCDIIAQAQLENSGEMAKSDKGTVSGRKSSSALSPHANREKTISKDKIPTTPSAKESFEMQSMSEPESEPEPNTPSVPAEGTIQNTQETADEVTVEMPNNRPTKIEESSRELLALGELTFASHSTYSAGRSNNVKPDNGLMLMNSTPRYFASRPVGEESPLLYDKATFKHQYPINTGVMISLAIGNRFSVETGIRYTLLRSAVNNYFPNQTIVQRIHYIGVPLGFNVEIYRYKTLSIYSGASAALDKAVGSFLGNRDLGIHPWQLSVSGRVGVSYSLVPAIAIYFEPGISYYFDDDSQLKTYYKQTPLSFSISMGIRFTPSFNW